MYSGVSEKVSEQIERKVQLRSILVGVIESLEG